MKKYLIVVDCQNDFTTGILRNEDAIAALPNVANTIREYVAKGYQLIFTRDTHDDSFPESIEGQLLPKHCEVNSEGWNVVSDIQDMPEAKDALFVDKSTFGFFGWKNILAENIEDIVLCGFCTDICVDSNAVILRNTYPNIPVSVVANSCAGLTPEKHNAALESMSSKFITII